MELLNPEIAALKLIFQKHKVTTKADRSRVLAGCSYYPWVQFELSGQSFQLYVDDEYADLKHQNPLLDLCLILRELEGFALTPDYEVWCKERFFDPYNAEVQEHHRQLEQVYQAVEELIGNIDSHISDFDFELNAGAAQELRQGE